VCVNLCEKEIAARGYQSWRQSTGFLASSFLSGKYKKKIMFYFIYFFVCVCPPINPLLLLQRAFF
jgi:hypothetical protein